MQRQHDRILTTHTGSLPRNAELLEDCRPGRRARGGDQIVAARRGGGQRRRGRQATAGIDIVSDGRPGQTRSAISLRPDGRIFGQSTRLRSATSSPSRSCFGSTFSPSRSPHTPACRVRGRAPLPTARTPYARSRHPAAAMRSAGRRNAGSLAGPGARLHRHAHDDGTYDRLRVLPLRAPRRCGRVRGHRDVRFTLSWTPPTSASSATPTSG